MTPSTSLGPLLRAYVPPLRSRSLLCGLGTGVAAALAWRVSAMAGGTPWIFLAGPGALVLSVVAYQYLRAALAPGRRVEVHERGLGVVQTIREGGRV